MALVIIDYGMGNLRSILRAFRRIGCDASISAEPEVIRRAERLVLPGVGHFARGVANLHQQGLVPLLREQVVEGRTPLLGICLGLQLLTSRSEEGSCDGLGWIDGETVRLRPDRTGGLVRVPHIGWNTISVTRPNQLLGESMDGTPLYFVHSYHLSGCRAEDVVAVTTYGGIEFPSAICRGHIMGTQFHPEKSHQRGLSILSAFLGSQ